MQSNQNQILGIFIEQLHQLSMIADNTACANGIDELRSNAFEISDLLGLNANYYFDVPTKYIASFLNKYQRDLKNSHDIALALLSETIDNVKMYFEGLLSMIRNLPRENLSPMEQPKSSAKSQQNVGINNQGNMNNNPYQPNQPNQPNPQPQSQTKSFFQNLFGSKAEKSPVQQQQQQQPQNFVFQQQQPQPFIVQQQQQPFIVQQQQQPQPFIVQQHQQPQSMIPVQMTGQCTVDKNGLTYYAQDAYACETCNVTAGAMVCVDCARVCHAGHKVVKRGQLKGYCDCRFLTTKCKLQSACTFKYTGPKHIAQQKFTCRTCRMNAQQGQMMCQHCADTCHKGHDIVYNGSTESGYCDCKSLYSFCTLNKRF